MQTYLIPPSNSLQSPADLVSRKKALIAGLTLILVAAATIRFGYVTMLGFLAGTIILIFYINEQSKHPERLTPREQSWVDYHRGRVKKKPWETVD